MSAKYRSHITGRFLVSDIDLSQASPTLRGSAGPPKLQDMESLLKPTRQEIGHFTIRPVVPPALVPVSSIRQMSTTSALGGSTLVPLHSTRPASAETCMHPPVGSDRASAGSYHPGGPALSDPDGISGAVTTMRKFMGLLTIGDKPGKDDDSDNSSPTRRSGARSSLRGSSRPRPSTAVAAASAGHAQSRKADASERALALRPETALLKRAPVDVASAIASSASGNAIVGTLFFNREHLMRVTMIAAKWVRILSTEYGSNALDACHMVVEMQRNFYTPFLNDLYDATGGDFTFDTEPAPTAIKANIGAINMLIQQGQTDFSEHLLPSHMSNKKRKFRVIEKPRSGSEIDQRTFRNLGLIAFDNTTADSGGATAPSTAVSPLLLTDGTSGGASGVGIKPTGSSSRVGPPVSGGGFTMTAWEAEAAELRYDAPLEWKGEKFVSRGTQDFYEFREAKKRTALRAGRNLARAAASGDCATQARLILKGEPVYFDPRSLHDRERGRVVPDEGDTPDSNPHVVTTDATVKPPIDWLDPLTGDTALMVAVRCSNVASVSSLMAMGADPHRVSPRGHTAIDVGVAMVEEAAAGIKKRVVGAVTRRMSAAQVIRMLDMRTLLEVAKNGDERRAKFLLEHLDADPNVRNVYGVTPLHFAVMHENAALAALLICNGANPLARNNLGQTPLGMIDDSDREKVREAMHAAFDNGGAADAARRARLKELAKQREREKAELSKFERKLRGLTRGTTAANTLKGVTEILGRAASEVKSASATATTAGVQLAALPKRRGGPDLMGTQVALDKFVGGDASRLPSRGATGFSRPLSSAVTASRPTLVGGRTSSQRMPDALAPVAHQARAAHTSGSGMPAPEGLYDESSKRHVRAYVAIAAKERDSVRARDAALSAKPKSFGSPASLAGSGVNTSNFHDKSAFSSFYTATAPVPLDSKFNVWFEAHVSDKEKTRS